MERFYEPLRLSVLQAAQPAATPTSTTLEQLAELSELLAGWRNAQQVARSQRYKCDVSPDAGRRGSFSVWVAGGRALPSCG